MVELFWQEHNPVGTLRKSQYKSAFWYANESQKAVLDSSCQRIADEYKQVPTTELLPRGTFFNAEDYHQKYVLQRHDAVMKKFNSFYPVFDDFVNSTAAARLNGLAYGCKPVSEFATEIDSYGFSSDELSTILR